VELEKTLVRKVGEAIHGFKMIRDGDRVAVALSGGKRSWGAFALRLRRHPWRGGGFPVRDVAGLRAEH
jgi:hypothetical protein